MTDRERMDREREGQDWARQVPWHYGRRGPYEDYGWERGESALPEFRDPSVHEMPYERERFSRPSGRRWPEGQGWQDASMDAQRRSTMQNPYDSDYGYDRGRSSRGYGREYGYDSERWRAGRQDMYGRDDDYGRDRGRMGSQGSFGRDYDQDRWSGGSYERDYESGRGRTSTYPSSPVSWTYTEYWLISGPFTGRGPRGYQRADDRIKEDVCERLTQHGQLDASNIEIDVSDGEVTLRGAVDNRQAKRMAEDAAESISGVRDVRNELRVTQEQHGMSGQQGASGQQDMQQRSVGGTQTTR